MSANNIRGKRAAVIGGGVIGGGWVARFLLMGCDVNVYDPDPEAERKITEVVNNARCSMPDLYEHRLPREGRLSFIDSLEAAVDDVDWVAESVPENLDLKQSILAQLQAACSPDCIIASSTSGFRPSELQSGLDNPAQVIVAHPFNPVYLVPLVELVGDSATIDKAKPILSDLGMYPLHVRKEIDAHIADRLLEAVWREGLWLVNDGIATTQEIDDAIRYGFGLRWAQMGLFETYRIAGGEAGMAHFIEQFGPALKWPWTKLMDVPELTPELIGKITKQSDAQSGHLSIRELERIRDNNLTSIMRALKANQWGAGELLNSIDDKLRMNDLPVDEKGLIISINRSVPDQWTDYNGHMNDSRYGEVFSSAADAMMAHVGADQTYIESGYSYFTVNTNIDYLSECHAGDGIRVLSKISIADGKKLGLEHYLLNDADTLLASCRQLLLHVDLSTRKSCPPSTPIMQCASDIANAHKDIAL